MPMSRSRAKPWMFGGQYLGKYGYPSQTTLYNIPSASYFDLCMDELHKGPPYRSGGPLYILKRRMKYGITEPNDMFYTSLPQAHYTGRFYLPGYLPSAMPTETTLAGWGARGWARTSPVKPIYQFGVSLAELRDIPRMLLSTHKFVGKLHTLRLHKNPKWTLRKFLKDWKVRGRDGLGSDYLNLQFGWAPVLADLLAIFNSGENLSKRLHQLKKDNGKPIRRSAELMTTSSERIIENLTGLGLTFSPTLSSYLYGPTAANYRFTRESYKRRIWYSASYTYWIPELHDPKTSSWQIFNLKRRILGIRLSPDTIYRSLPWTWLIDWFTNVGDVVANMSNNAEYHLVARYAYVMAKESYTWTKTGAQTIKIGTWASGGTPTQRTQKLTTVSSIEWQRREEANPYGFGISDGALSLYQWSILVALGLTRFR